MLLVGRERDVVHARAVAAGQRGVVDGLLAVHPDRVRRALGVLDVLRHPEAEALQVGAAAGHVRGDLVEVVEPHQLARRVEVVAAGEPLDVLDVVEELVGEPERVLHPHRIADPADEPTRPPLGAAAQLPVPGFGAVDVLGRAHPEGERRDGGHRPPAQHQVVVDELLERAQVDGRLVLGGDVQAEQVDVEPARGRQVADHKVEVGAADDVRGSGVTGVPPVIGRRSAWCVRRRG